MRTTLEDISRNVAGLTVQNLGPGQSQVSIRGVSAGQIVRDQPGVKEQVGVYLDELVISLSLFTPDFDLFDLNRVETLRGPQGTLFGSGSVGGTLRYITNQPKLGVDRRHGRGQRQYGRRGRHRLSSQGRASTSRSATPRRSARSAMAPNIAGFIDAVGPAGGKNVNDGSRIGGRVVAAVGADAGHQDHAARRLPGSRRPTASTARSIYNLYDNQFTTGAAGTDLGERAAISASCARSSGTRPGSPISRRGL